MQSIQKRGLKPRLAVRSLLALAIVGSFGSMSVAAEPEKEWTLAEAHNDLAAADASADGQQAVRDNTPELSQDFTLDLSKGLSLTSAINLAIQNSNLLLAEQALQRDASLRSEAALEQTDPVLLLQVDNLPINTSNAFNPGAEPITRRAIGLQQRWIRQAKREALAAMSRGEVGLSKAMEKAAELEISKSTAKAWVNLSVAKRKLTMLQELSTEMQLQADAAAALYEAGTGPQPAVFAAQTDLELLKLRIAQADTEVRNARIELSRWTGVEADAADQIPDLSFMIGLNELDFADIERYPQVLIEKQKASRQQADVAMKQAELEPDWTVSLLLTKRGDQFSDLMSLGFSRPLLTSVDQRQQKQLSASEARLESIQQNLLEQEKVLLSQSRQLWQNWQDGLARMNDLKTRILPLAAQRSQAALDAYSGGTVALAQVLMARKTEIDLQIELLQIERQTAVWWADLQYRLLERSGV